MERSNQFVLWVLIVFACGCAVDIVRSQNIEILEYVSDGVSEEVREEIKKLLEGPQPTGVNDPSLSNAEVNENIAELLYSGQPDKIDEGLSQLNKFVEFVNWNSSGERASPPVMRDFAAIPGLKEFLLWYWRKNVQESGGPPRFIPPVEVFPAEELEILQDVEKFKEWLASDEPPPCLGREYPSS